MCCVFGTKCFLSTKKNEMLLLQLSSLGQVYILQGVPRLRKWFLLLLFLIFCVCFKKPFEMEFSNNSLFECVFVCVWCVCVIIFIILCKNVHKRFSSISICNPYTWQNGMSEIRKTGKKLKSFGLVRQECST